MHSFTTGTWQSKLSTARTEDRNMLACSQSAVARSYGTAGQVSMLRSSPWTSYDFQVPVEKECTENVRSATI